MNKKVAWFTVVLLLVLHSARAQKPFTEGVVVYKVTILTPDKTSLAGTYTFTYKGSMIRKDLRLANGFEDVVILDYASGKGYSLQVANGKKYAIELDMDEMKRKQERFTKFTVRNEEHTNSMIAGYASYRGNIVYRDGTGTTVSYTKEYQPPHPAAFERFPDAHFLPLSFSYSDEQGVTMQFDAERIAADPVTNAIFRVPADYKMISNAEYKQLIK